MMENRLSYKSENVGIFEHGNSKRELEEIIYPDYIYILEEITSLCIKEKGVDSSNIYFLLRNDAF